MRLKRRSGKFQSHRKFTAAAETAVVGVVAILRECAGGVERFSFVHRKNDANGRERRLT